MYIGLDVVAIDLPGHGQSSHRGPGSRYNFLDYLADLKRAVEGKFIISIHFIVTIVLICIRFGLEGIYIAGTFNG